MDADIRAKKLERYKKDDTARLVRKVESTGRYGDEVSQWTRDDLITALMNEKDEEYRVKTEAADISDKTDPARDAQDVSLSMDPLQQVLITMQMMLQQQQADRRIVEEEREERRRADEFMRQQLEQRWELERMERNQTARRYERQQEAMDSRAGKIKRYGDTIKHLFTKMSDDDAELPIYLDTVEHLFNAHGVPDEIRAALITPYLTEKAKRFLCKLELGLQENFADFKRLLLKEFKLTAKQYKHQFDEAQKKNSESYVQFSTRLDSLINYYLKSRNVDNYENIVQLLISDKLKASMPNHLRNYILNKEGDGWLKADKIADLADIFVNNQTDYGASHKNTKSRDDWKNTFQGQNHNRNQKPNANPNANGGSKMSSSTNQQSTIKNDRENKCTICGRNHKSTDCWYRNRSAGRGNGTNNNQPKYNNFNRSGFKQSQNNNSNKPVESNLTTVQSPLAAIRNEDDDNDGEDEIILEDCAQLFQVTKCAAKKQSKVQLAELQYADIEADGSALRAVIDSGCQLTVIKRNKLADVRKVSDRSILLSGAFGDEVEAKIAIVGMKLKNSGNKNDVIFVTCAVVDKMNTEADCLLTVKDYNRLIRTSQLAVLRSGKIIGQKTDDNQLKVLPSIEEERIESANIDNTSKNTKTKSAD